MTRFIVIYEPHTLRRTTGRMELEAVTIDAPSRLAAEEAVGRAYPGCRIGYAGPLLGLPSVLTRWSNGPADIYVEDPS